MTAAPEPALLDVTRGELVESVHRGGFVVLDAAGGVEVAAGDIDGPVYARSALKPLQAAAMLRSGLTASRDAVALAAASHDGSELHRGSVRAALAAAGSSDAELGCPPDLPLGERARIDYLAAGGQPAPVCHNCSGKHAAMVATCHAKGWDVAAYLEPSAPLQVAIARYLEDVCASPIAATSVDGCGAPAHAISLTALAVGFASLATAASESPEGIVVRAMRERPDLVGGPERPVTQFLSGVAGLVCKDGAEGVWAGALPDGRAVAVKVADGASRATAPVFAAVLTHWGLDVPVVDTWRAVDVLGGGRPVGSIRWSAELRALLSI